MYCNITQLHVKKEKKKKMNKKLSFYVQFTYGQHFPPPSHIQWAKMCTQFCQYLKDLICRFGQLAWMRVT